MHWNHKKVSVLARHFSFLDMLLFSKGMGLKNDIFCLISFLTPLIAAKTSTNIWKQVGIFQNPSQDQESTKVGSLDPILHLSSAPIPANLAWKIDFFAFFFTFFQFFVVNGPLHLWKQIRASQYLAGGTTSTISGHVEHVLAMKMTISNPENWLKN